MISHLGRVTSISPREMVVLYPTYGHLSDDGRTWRVHVAGAILDPSQVTFRKRIMLRLLRKAMKVSPEHFETEIFRHRIGGFTAETGRGRRVVVRVGSRDYVLPRKSKSNGQFAGALRIPCEQVIRMRRTGELADDWLDVRIVAPRADDREFTGRARLIEPTGISIVSDIDDTIKHSEVTCRRALLTNTFLRVFESIDGMSDQYRAWQDHGATFHYVSSSPWQLFDPLWQLCQDEAFPAGTMHLRSFRIRDHMLRRMLLIRRPGKGVVIKRMLQTFPRRRFFLIGDSGERDPELYAALARRFPAQVAGIFIRQIAARPMHAVRCRKTFRRLPLGHWQVFQEAGQLPERLEPWPPTGITPCVAGANGSS